MPAPTSRLAYKPYYDLLERALGSKAGLRIPAGNRGEAKHLQMRLNFARQMDRDLSRSTYKPTDPQHGVSIYDLLIIGVKGDDEYGEVTIKHSIIPTDVEEIVA